MRILYVGQLSPGDSAEYRRGALERQGHTTRAIDVLQYRWPWSLAWKVELRTCFGPYVWKLNRDILRAAEEFAPDVVWCDKVQWMQTSTLQELRRRGIYTLSYMIDNFFGPRNDPGWRLYRVGIPFFDLHCTQRDANVVSYRAAGARDVIKVQTAFEPTIHYPSVPPYIDAQRNREVSFIGTRYDDRAEKLMRLHADGVPVVVSGHPRHWEKPFGALFPVLFREGELFQRRYREAIWRSKINLSFLTHSNQDEFAHKTFEIAACGGFLMAERSPGHSERFVEDEEAVFFTGYDELLQKIRYYLPNEAARNRIALAGMKRAWSSGYDNDSQVRRIVEHVKAHVNKDRGSAA